jgi:hypothetical protein
VRCENGSSQVLTRRFLDGWLDVSDVSFVRISDLGTPKCKTYVPGINLNLLLNTIRTSSLSIVWMLVGF